jgi:hypothetical protein
VPQPTMLPCAPIYLGRKFKKAWTNRDWDKIHISDKLYCLGMRLHWMCQGMLLMYSSFCCISHPWVPLSQTVLSSHINLTIPQHTE